VDRRLVLSGIVTRESRAKVVGEAGVVPAVIDRALEEIHVVHGPSNLATEFPGQDRGIPKFGGSLFLGAGSLNREQLLSRSLKPTSAEPTVGSLRFTQDNDNPGHALSAVGWPASRRPGGGWRRGWDSNPR
jgi:hypothetical protein